MGCRIASKQTRSNSVAWNLKCKLTKQYSNKKSSSDVENKHEGLSL